MQISLIIPTLNRRWDLLNALDSVITQDLLPNEIVIVDAGSDMGLEKELKELYGNKIKLVYIKSKPGLTYQRNLGVLSSSCDIITFIDDDSVLLNGYFSEILKIFANDLDNSIAAVCSRIVNVHQSRISKLFTEFFLLGDQGEDGCLKLSGFMSSPYRSESVKEVSFLSGGVMSFRKSIFKHIRFDENFYGWATMEDVDIARQIKKLGKKILYSPFSSQNHYPSEANRLKRNSIMAMVVRNHYYLFTKHSGRTIIEILAFFWSLLGLAVVAMFRGGVKGYIRTIGKVLTGNSIKFELGKQYKNV